MKRNDQAADDPPDRDPGSLLRIHSTEDVRHPELRALYELWKERAGDRLAPSRKHFDVPDLKRWLPHLQLLDVVNEISDVRYRVIGTWIADFYGKDDTGKTFAEIGINDQRHQVLNEFLTAARYMESCVIVRPFYSRDEVKEHIRAERILLPLSSDGQSCDKILSGIYELEGAD